MISYRQDALSKCVTEYKKRKLGPRYGQKHHELT